LIYFKLNQSQNHRLLEDKTKYSDENAHFNQVDETDGESSQGDIVEPIPENTFESYQTTEADQIEKMQDQTTIFMNKYCEDPNLPSVANQLAEMIVDFEMANKIPVDDDCDFELDNEIVNKEEFLKIIDQS
jgi:hypothetical protein